jgi:hypothetical protein
MRLSIANKAKRFEQEQPAIDVTPQMIEAGLPFLLSFNREEGCEQELLATMFRAMSSARRSDPQAQPQI